jgi:DNA polymerase-3 subunit gamma/tau
MYQALYRKWRPRTFDDVVGQSHITDTLKQQVAGDRLSHAYLFTGTRGTGKTTCAKILARAVNCQNPQGGNPCNQCPACLGIENGSILDVLELDAASNNGVDQVRALRDEAVYTPAAVRKRVYIVDEVHMLSTPAFNALLKILEEPPAHLMFILATTELHKVPATIKSRCQQFSFKRILPGQIAQRLLYVAGQEGIDLTSPGAALLARLADGGLRDALSLLDQCCGGGQTVDEQAILDTLGLAGNLETAKLMDQIAGRDTSAALETLARLYAGGKDVGSVLSELSALTRDLLLRKTAPQGGAALLTGGYDETTMRALGERFPAQRLLQMLSLLQSATADLARSSNRRTDAELCLIRLCDESLDQSFSGLAARIARLEERVNQGVPAAAPIQGTAPAQVTAAPPRAAAPDRPPAPAPAPHDPPPWEEARPPLPEEPPEMPRFSPPEPEPAPRVQRPAAPPAAPAAAGTGDRAFWPAFAAGLRGKVSPSVLPYLSNPSKVTGVWNNNVLTLWTDTEFTRTMLNKPAVLDSLAQAAAAAFGGQPRVSVVTGTPPAERPPSPAPAAAPAPPAETGDALDELLAFGAQFDNIIIQ